MQSYTGQWTRLPASVVQPCLRFYCWGAGYLKEIAKSVAGCSRGIANLYTRFLYDFPAFGTKIRNYTWRNNAEISHRRAIDTNLETIGILLLLIVDWSLRFVFDEGRLQIILHRVITYAHIVSLFKLSELSLFFLISWKLSCNTVMLCCKEIKWNDSNCDDTTQSIANQR